MDSLLSTSCTSILHSRWYHKDLVVLPCFGHCTKPLLYTLQCIIRVCVIENRRLTLANYAGQSGLELLFGLLHLLLVLTLLARQPADVAVGGLDHGVEVVGVPTVDFTSFQPGQEDAHRLRKLPVVLPGGEDTEKGRVRRCRGAKIMK